MSEYTSRADIQMTYGPNDELVELLNSYDVTIAESDRLLSHTHRYALQPNELDALESRIERYNLRNTKPLEIPVSGFCTDTTPHNNDMQRIYVNAATSDIAYTSLEDAFHQTAAVAVGEPLHKAFIFQPLCYLDIQNQGDDLSERLVGKNGAMSEMGRRALEGARYSLRVGGLFVRKETSSTKTDVIDIFTKKRI